MPYLKDGKKYTRISEHTGYLECEALSWNDKHLDINRPRKANVVTLAGTITHHKIAENEQRLMTIKPPRLHFEMEAQEREMFLRLQKDHRIQKKLQKADVNGRFANMPSELKMTKYERIMEDVMIFYSHYQQFILQHPHKPLFVEQKQFWEKKQLAGTLDLVAVFKLKGNIVETPIHDEIGQRKYFFEDPTGVVHDVATIVDWKTSKSKQKSHPIQLSGYHYMWEDLGIFNEIRKRGFHINASTWSVLLGKPKRYPRYHPEGQLYQHYKYDVDSSYFLVAERIRNDPRPLTTDQDGNIGLKGRCMFCSEAAYCPENILFPHNFRADEMIPLVPFRLIEISNLRMAMKDLKNPNLQYLKDKMNKIYTELVERVEVYQDHQLDKEFLKDIDVILGHTPQINEPGT